ncbi:MAG: peptidase M22 [Ruminococcus sp.]|nr:peptidase M22 [Ruminococcus sp.]
MAEILGIDTSNYTTSAALLDTDRMSVVQSKLLLPVKSGERGIRQSDAVFHHVKQLPTVIDGVCRGIVPDGIGVSVKPRTAEGSYMPCFLAGESAARMLGSVLGIEPEYTSHQTGHVLAALFSAGRLGLVLEKQTFAAFHVSGGTTDLLLCEPDDDTLLRITRVGGSSDLNAGQAVDRCGVMLGLDFPCGQELEKLASRSGRQFKARVPVKGLDCSLSGIENKCRKMYDDNEPREDIAKFCLDSVLSAVSGLTDALYENYGSMTVIYAGGVMSNSYIRSKLEGDGRFFCEPEFSRDNAAGTAVYCALRKGLIK